MTTRKALALVSGLFQEINTPTDGIDFAGNDTDDLSEGSSNQYFTNARARGAISVTDSGGDGSLGYNSSTGVITYTGPSASEVRAHLSVAGVLDSPTTPQVVNLAPAQFQILSLPIALLPLAQQASR